MNALKRCKHAVPFVALLALVACSSEQDGHLVVEVTEQPLEHSVTSNGELVSAASTKISLQPGAMHTIDWIVSDRTEVKEGDVIIRLSDRISQFRRDQSEISLEREKALGVGTLTEFDQRDLEIDYDLRVVEEELTLIDQFSSDSDEVYSRLEQIDNARNRDYTEARGSYLGWDRDSNLDRRESKENLTQISQTRIERDVDRFNTLVSQGEIRAPHDGVVVLQRSRRSGQLISAGSVEWGGSVIAEMPDLDQLVGEVYLLAADSAGVVEGTSVSARFDMYPDVEVTGTVTSISSLAQGRPDYLGKWFTVTIQFDELPDVLNKRVNVSFRAEFDILETEPVVTIPIDALERVGNYWQVVLADGSYQRVEVGRRSLSDVEITAGLEAGDRVRLDK